MNIFWCIVFIAIGIAIIVIAPRIGKPKEDYSKYPTKIATVYNTYDSQWYVILKEENGEEVFGVDDWVHGSTFHPEKYHMPKPNTQEKVYYYVRKNQYNFNGKKVKYYIHFCNDELYDLNRLLDKKTARGSAIIGTIFIVVSCLIALFG